MDASKDPYKAALIFHDHYEGSADTEETVKQRGEYAKQFFDSEGKGQINGNSKLNSSSSPSGSGSSGGSQKPSGLTGFDIIDNAIKGLKDTELGKTLAKFSPFFSNFFNGGTSGGAGASGNWASSSTDAGIKAASEWAQSMVGKEGYGNNNDVCWRQCAACAVVHLCISLGHSGRGVGYGHQSTLGVDGAARAFCRQEKIHPL